MDCTLGIDIGGTKILFAAVDSDGNILEKDIIPTPTFDSKQIIQVIENYISFYKEKYKIIGIGIGVPGICDVEKGIAIYAANVPSLRNLNLVRLFSDKFKIPVYIDNDVRVATLGEKWYGAGRNYETIICITLGTGIGSGIILKGKLWRGANYCAGEIGTLKLKDNGLTSNWGITGSLEAIASGPAIATTYEKLKNNVPVMGKVDTTIPASVVFEEAKTGNSKALRVVEEAGKYLGIAVAGYVNLINPQMVIIGGGLADVGDIIFKPFMEAYKEYVLFESKRICKIVRAELGNNAGAIGAATMVRYYLNKNIFWI